MSDNMFNVLDVNAIDRFIELKPVMNSMYSDLCKEYDSIVAALASEWRGRGGDAFVKDAIKVKSNIKGIKDVLNTMCDMLIDCRNFFEECDNSIGSANRKAGTEK